MSDSNIGSRDPELVLVAHGTRNPRGVQVIGALAEAVSERVGRTRVAFVDVLGPSPSEVLRRMETPTVVLPAFLASGYHVRVDVPREVADSGHADVTVTPALGPSPALAGVQFDRLRAAGWRPGDDVVLVAAGSSDPRALADVRAAAAVLSDLIGRPVEIGYVTTAAPRVPEVVARIRARGARRVLLAPYLLAPGLFHDRLREAGADAVADPLGVHPGLVDLVVRRYTDAVRVPARVR
ncbi:sirohydrochlorin chelatase [Rhodococcus sp. D2-41]|uniref:sirohydrochlorin chelatase n=1 Tax=Speluncibacter jeojiensis TaxID=2710754 RepID=UPI00240EC15E|nr:sirohydrochlorin chelatase [Rhodococcus sp. D2-41]MDG3008738.1 sirohydrochlorin chelatase [Rhodococcus sp. D2-41]